MKSAASPLLVYMPYFRLQQVPFRIPGKQKKPQQRLLFLFLFGLQGFGFHFFRDLLEEVLQAHGAQIPVFAGTDGHKILLHFLVA